MKKEEWAAVILSTIFILAPLFFGGAWPLIYEHWKYEGSYAPQETTIIGWLTVGVMAFQAWVYRQQRILMSRQADISEQAMTVGQWPYLYVRTPNFITPLGTGRAGMASCDYILVVHGSSPATIRRVYEDLVFELVAPPPPSPVAPGWLIVDAVRTTNQTWPRTANYNGDPAALTAPGTGRRRYFYVGAVIYDDLFGNQHEFGFCYVAPRAGGEGLLHGGTQYNYRRIRNQEERI